MPATLFRKFFSLLAVYAGAVSPSFAQTTGTRGGTLDFSHSGTGSPTVVFEAGLGNGLESWAAVAPAVSEFTGCFVYSRAGNGGSAPATNTRDGAQIVEDLRELLKSQGLPPPYVLVGHSAGGLYAQLFARKYPHEIAGIVLVDSSHPEQGPRTKAALPEQYASTRESWKQLPEPLRREADQFDRTGEEVLAAPPMPRVPTIILSATQPAEGPGAEGRKFFLTLQADLVAKIPGAEQWLAPRSRHNIQRDEPELVIRAIRQVWEAAAKGGH